MTKQNEIDILLETAKKLGANSYCAGWLLDQIPQIESDMRSDMFPQTTWAESRRIQEQNIRDSQTQSEQILKHAKEKADKLVADAEKQSTQIRNRLTQDLQHAIDSL